MSRELIEYLVNSYTEENFELVKDKFVIYKDRFSKMKGDKTLTVFLNVITEYEMIHAMTRNQMIQILAALFEEQLEDDRWCGKYLEMLLSTIPNIDGRFLTGGKAKQYTDYMYLLCKDACSKKGGFASRDAANKIKLLSNCLKMAVAIQAQYPDKVTEESPIRAIDFRFRERDFENFIAGMDIRDKGDEEEYAFTTSLGKLFKEKVSDKAKDYLDQRYINNERKVLFSFVSWMLMYHFKDGK